MGCTAGRVGMLEVGGGGWGVLRGLTSLSRRRSTATSRNALKGVPRDRQPDV